MMAVNNPEDPDAGKRKVPLGASVYIERADFEEDPPPKYYRMRPGGEVRLRYSYCITCNEVVKMRTDKLSSKRKQSASGKLWYSFTCLKQICAQWRHQSVTTKIRT